MQPLWRAEERRRGRGHAQAAVGDLSREISRVTVKALPVPVRVKALRIPLQLYLTHRGLRTRGVWHDVVDSLLNKTLKHMELDLHFDFLSCAYTMRFDRWPN